MLLPMHGNLHTCSLLKPVRAVTHLRGTQYGRPRCHRPMHFSFLGAHSDKVQRQHCVSRPAFLVQRRQNFTEPVRRLARPYAKAVQAKAAAAKIVWIETADQAVMTAAVESGLSTFLFASGKEEALAAEWKRFARIVALFKEGPCILNEAGQQVGRLQRISGPEELSEAESLSNYPGVVVMDATDWQIIPAENLVATYQAGQAQLLARVSSAADARVMLEALEVGTHGVVLSTEDPAEVRELAAYLKGKDAEGPSLKYEVASVLRVEPIGMGDRVCVDMCSILSPGEGLLVGSFSRALFLVHSECAESRYISSRPFRVNAGPVHAYIAAPGGKTAYLSELANGAQALIVDPEGRQRTGVVGRVKIESRPLVLVEAETNDGQRHSTLLQNAETVRLVGPAADSPAAARPPEASQVQEDGISNWRAVSVSELRSGDQVYVLRQAGARHTGISIQETITEK